jgi:hypothetical protein
MKHRTALPNGFLHRKMGKLWLPIFLDLLADPRRVRANVCRSLRKTWRSGGSRFRNQGISW